MQKTSDGAYISLIVPSYRQQKTIASDLKSINKALSSLTSRYEIIVVIDGDVDGTAEQIKKIKSKKIKVLSYEKNQGKGYAVKYGVMHASGDLIGFIDAKILSWGYRTFTHLLFGFSVRDTQVGLKIFKRQVAKDVFPRLLVKRFAFDVEALAVSYALGYKKIYEAPIKLKFKSNSSITSANFWRIIFWMMVDTLAVFYRLKILRYYSKST
jgi:glycosyltransferase involved in cell wall biosynthesis